MKSKILVTCFIMFSMLLNAEGFQLPVNKKDSIFTYSKMPEVLPGTQLFAAESDLSASMKYNGRLTFEMLAVRAKPRGFEIEFTDAIGGGLKIPATDFLVQQWWYLPTADYGGPKMDLQKLKVRRISVSKDRRRVFLEIQGLRKEHVVYFRLPEYLQSVSGQFLWSSEAWYTLNGIPK